MNPIITEAQGYVELSLPVCLVRPGSPSEVLGDAQSPTLEDMQALYVEGCHLGLDTSEGSAWRVYVVKNDPEVAFAGPWAVATFGDDLLVYTEGAAPAKFKTRLKGAAAIVPPCVTPSGVAIEWLEGRSIVGLERKRMETDAAQTSPEMRALKECLDRLPLEWVHNDANRRGAIDAVWNEVYDKGEAWRDVAYVMLKAWAVKNSFLLSFENAWKTLTLFTDPEFGTGVPERATTAFTVETLAAAANQHSKQSLKVLLDPIIDVEAAIEVASRLQISEILCEVAVSLITEAAKTRGESVSITVVRRALLKARKTSRRDAANQANGELAVGLEDALAREVVRRMYTWRDGTRTIRVLDSFVNIWLFSDGLWTMVTRDVIAGQVYQAIGSMQQPLQKGEEDSELRQRLKALQGLLQDSGRLDTLNQLSDSVTNSLLKILVEEGESDPLNLRGLAEDGSEKPSMNCANGLLVFEEDGTFNLIDHHPNQRMTSRLSVAYTPGAECPLWKETVTEIFSRCDEPHEVVRHMQEVGGYTMNLKRDNELFVVMRGPGSNGKSLIPSTIVKILGSHSVYPKALSSIDEGRNNHALVPLVGKLLVWEDDWQEGAIIPDGLIKKIAERKLMSANPKGKGEFSFLCKSVPWINSNPWPIIRDTSKAFRDRAHVIMMTRVFDRSCRDPKSDEFADRSRGSKINDELPGILNWFIAGYVRYMQRGSMFHKPAWLDKGAKEWFQERSPIQTFLTEEFMVTREPTDILDGKKLWEVFQVWSADTKLGEKFGRNKFYADLSLVPGVGMLEGTSTTRRFYGLRRINEAAPQPSFKRWSDTFF